MARRDEVAKYKTLTELAAALKNGEVKAAHCIIDKEVYDVREGKLSADYSTGEPPLLFTISEYAFPMAAFAALGIEADHV